MFQRDYILRMIESITHIMARFLQLQAQEKEMEALVMLEQYYSKLMLPPSRLLLQMSDQELLNLLSINGEPDLDKVVSLALLLKEEGSVQEALGHEEASFLRWNKALFLFIIAANKGADVPGIHVIEQLDELRELLRTYPIRAGILQLLIDLYERLGRYADAEDCLFELLEGEKLPVPERYLKLGQQFFERLDRSTDDQLSEGNLPRHEVEQGREELHRRFGERTKG